MDPQVGKDNSTRRNNEAPLPIEQQRAILRGCDNPINMLALYDAVLKLRLPEILPIKIRNPESYRSIRESPVYENDDIISVTTHAAASDAKHNIKTKIFNIKTFKKSQLGRETGIVEINGSNAQPNSENKGTAMKLNIDSVGASLLGGLVYVQYTNEPIYDAVIVFNESGTIVDILPPGDYHGEEQYGETIRRANAIEDSTGLNVLAAGELEQLEASLDGVTLAHQRRSGEYDELQNRVAQLYGRDRDRLIGARIDPFQTFGRVMNDDDLTELDLETGDGKYSIPPLVWVDENPVL